MPTPARPEPGLWYWVGAVAPLAYAVFLVSFVIADADFLYTMGWRLKLATLITFIVDAFVYGPIAVIYLLVQLGKRRMSRPEALVTLVCCVGYLVMPFAVHVIRSS
jgi:hypothetical protein